MMKVYKFPTDQLDKVIQTATKPDWTERYCATAFKLITDRPERYKQYGPYWWVLKKEILSQGHDIGAFTDAEWLEYLDYGNTEYNIAAAYLYAEEHREVCFAYSAEHTYYYTEGDEGTWEQGIYVLDDPDIM